ncbi:hypothetical protein C2E19_05370 [Pseudomonas sp. DTU12.3]|uniref:hypothetical protein n=1 Tax=Pseudomonas sp. DTU12.3 TaxID=2073078 RepID=UPI001010D9D4|nr:hypothetical protein [Pseudomonas sp. DTU12.3]QAX83300.1 hypothetical protein C2E19_05370 [Pseudomonas sp. DTU12.3]
MLTVASASKHKSRLDRTAKVIQDKQKIIAFFIAALLFYLIQKHIDARFFLGDAKDYWYLSSYIWNFSFPENLRGYFFPLLLSPAKYLSETFPQLGYFPLRLLQAFAYSYSLCILLPDLFSRIFGGHVTLLRRLIVPCLVAIFFPGLISYPLSDLPAFSLILSSIYLLISAEKKTSHSGMYAMLFAAGLLAYGACNTRPIYIFTLVALAISIPLLIFGSRALSTKILATLIFALGAATCSIPQAMINIKHFNSSSPLVISNIGETSLFATQLKWGITIQRYETLLDKSNEKVSGIYYFYPAGEEFFKSRGLNEVTATVPWYLGMVLSEPVVFSRIYLRHFINGIDVRDQEVYTTSPSVQKSIRSAISIALFFFGFFLLARSIPEPSSPASDTKKQTLSRLFWLIVLIIPVVAIIPGAIETRFFFPLQVICYSAIAFKTSIPTSKSLLTTKALLLILVYVILVSYSIVTTNASMLNRTSIIFESHKAID